VRIVWCRYVWVHSIYVCVCVCMFLCVVVFTLACFGVVVGRAVCGLPPYLYACVCLYMSSRVVVYV